MLTYNFYNMPFAGKNFFELYELHIFMKQVATILVTTNGRTESLAPDTTVSMANK